MSTRLTATRIRGLKAGPRQRDISDVECRGLTLRIQPGGSRTWLFRYKWHGAPVRLSLGPEGSIALHEARTLAREHRALLDRGIDPRTSRRSRRPAALPLAAGSHAPHSIEFLAHEYLERHVKPNRKEPEYVSRILYQDVLSEWKGRDARTLKPREVVELLDKVLARGSKVMANRTATILGQMFKFGIHRDIVDDSPVKLLFRPGGKERPRSRALSEAELKAFLANLDEACRFQRLPHVLRLLLLTLQRRGELCQAEWREFDFKNATWTIPDEHAKGARGHVLPLSGWALEELQKLKVMANGSRYVLPNMNRTGPMDPKYITRSVARCLKRFRKVGIQAFTPHDLRRTGRTGLARLGIRPDIAERVVNHAREDMVGVYDVHTYIDEKRAALDKWAAHLRSISAPN